MPATDTTTQTTIEGVRHDVTTRDKRFTIRFPLPPARSAIAHPVGTHRRVILRDMNRLLNLGHPVVCPLTGHLVRIYRRGLHVSQVSTLRRLRQATIDTGSTYVHLRQFSGRRDGDLAKMVHWGLVAAKPSENDGCIDRGFWQITALGRLWLMGDFKVPRQIALLNGEFLSFVDASDKVGPDEVSDTFDRAALEAGRDGVVVGAPA